MLDTDYKEAARIVLEGANIRDDVLTGIAKSVNNQNFESLKLALVEEDFHWPWFDECLELFKEWNKWPVLAPWSWFEESSVLYTGKKDVLDKLPTKILRNIAARFQIAIPSRSKVADIRALIAKKTTVDQLAPYRTILNKKIIEKDQARQLEAKFKLLEISISSKAYHLHRHLQISELVTTMNYKVKMNWEDSLAKKIAGDYQFDVNNTKNTPPFYPGDSSYLSSIRPKR